MSYTFGTAIVAGKTGWLVQSFTKNKTAQEALALNNVGEPADVTYYQKVTEFSLDVIVPADESSFPEIGDVFTYENVKYFVSGVTITASNTDYERYSLSAKRFITTNLPA